MISYQANVWRANIFSPVKSSVRSLLRALLTYLRILNSTILCWLLPKLHLSFPFPTRPPFWCKQGLASYLSFLAPVSLGEGSTHQWILGTSWIFLCPVMLSVQQVSESWNLPCGSGLVNVRLFQSVCRGPHQLNSRETFQEIITYIFKRYVRFLILSEMKQNIRTQDKIIAA